MLRKKLKLDVRDNRVDPVMNDNQPEADDEEILWKKLWQIEQKLSFELSKINFIDKTINAVYNPLDYAEDVHINYLNTYLKG
jgi:hypothetical protein